MFFEMAGCCVDIKNYQLYLPNCKTIFHTFTNNKFGKVKVRDKVVLVLN
jgi:hypothetical protein